MNNNRVVSGMAKKSAKKPELEKLGELERRLSQLEKKLKGLVDAQLAADKEHF